MEIAIVNYGTGNLQSVLKGLETVGLKAEITADKSKVMKARAVVLPGVGAFADAMQQLKRTGLDQVLRDVAQMGKPLLGICLGHQLLFEASEEWQYTAGLGFFPGVVRKIPPVVKVPHMGWNEVHLRTACPLFAGIPDRTRFYFVHSYYVYPEIADFVTGETYYGTKLAAAVASSNIFGIQFHPEKSSRFGLQILRNFGRLVHQC